MNCKMILGVVFTISLLIASAHAEVPSEMNYQGKLTNEHGAPVPNDDYEMRFCIYSDSTGGDSLWSEIQPSVTVRKGLFSVLLGSIEPIPDTVFNGLTRWLGIRVPPDAEMTPKEPIVSVGYAFRSSRTDTAAYALSAPASPDDDWVISGDTIYHLIGNVGIGTSSPTEKLHVKGNIRVQGGTGGGQPNIRFTDEPDGHDWRIAVTTEGMYINDETASRDILVFRKEAGNIGIGTMNPSELLHLQKAGTSPVRLRFSAAGVSGFDIGHSGACDAFTIERETSELFRITSDGDVGIGTTGPDGKLHVTVGSAGVTPYSSSDDLIVEGSGATGISILTSGGSNDARISFGSPTNANAGEIFYSFDWANGGAMRFGTGTGSDKMVILGNGNLGIGTTSPARKLHINDVMRLEPRGTFPANPSDGDLCVKGTPSDYHIFCYLNGAWRQLD